METLVRLPGGRHRISGWLRRSTGAACLLAVVSTGPAGVPPEESAPALPDADPPRLAVSFAPEVTRVLDSYLPQSDLFVGDDIPEKKLRSALACRKAESPAAERVLGLIDATIFGSASSHLLFTAEGVYFRTLPQINSSAKEGYIPYEDFPALKFTRSGPLEIMLGAERAFDVSGCDVSGQKIVDLLNDLKAAVLATARAPGAAP